MSVSKFGMAAVGLVMVATQAFAQGQDSEGSVEHAFEPGAVFDVCAEHALTNTPETEGIEGAVELGEIFARLGSTRLELDGQGGVTASGPGKETAIREYIACVTDPNLNF